MPRAGGRRRDEWEIRLRTWHLSTGEAPTGQGEAAGDTGGRAHAPLGSVGVLEVITEAQAVGDLAREGAAPLGYTLGLRNGGPFTGPAQGHLTLPRRTLHYEDRHGHVSF